MRQRFEVQRELGQLPIEHTQLSPKSSFRLTELFAALKEIYCNKEYNEQLFSILEDDFPVSRSNRGRNGMNLWTVFVFAQVRLCGNMSYEELHDLANNHKTLRQLIGAEYEIGYKQPEFGYQNIYDNVSQLSDETLSKINALVVEFGHREVFKKKEKTALRLKSDSFVVESNVHFPTDYNLLWDCLRKMLDVVVKLLDKGYNIKGWRKEKDWRRSLKNLSRALGKASSAGGKNKTDREEQAAKDFLDKAKRVVQKADELLRSFSFETEEALGLLICMEHFNVLAKKHIDLVERRIINKEKIPHGEKMFSVFETYTEWIKKGKSRPSVELGKKVCITTDQYNLIVDHRIMQDQQDKDITIDVAQDLLEKFSIDVWSFDKGFWDKQVKDLLETDIKLVVMPKKGKTNQKEKQLEQSPRFKRYRNQHSAVESNINELEQRGADRCPDKGWRNFQKYVSISVCAYNLKKIGRQILKSQYEAELARQEQAAA